MKLSLQELEELAASARLALRNEEEKERLCVQIGDMIVHAEALQRALPTFERMESEEERGNCRADTVQKSLPPETVLALAPVTDGDYLAVARAVEEEA